MCVGAPNGISALGLVHSQAVIASSDDSEVPCRGPEVSPPCFRAPVLRGVREILREAKCGRDEGKRKRGGQ